MADEKKNPPEVVAKGRPMGGTEQTWCRSVSGGTGITVLALQLSKPPNIPLLQNVLHKLHISHPILRSKLQHNTTSTKSFSFITPSSPHLNLKVLNFSSTPNADSFSPLRSILEQELNRGSWSNPERYEDSGVDMFFASVYALPDEKWVVALRLHTAVCDRTTAVGLLRELRELMVKGEGEGTQKEIGKEWKVSLGIEDLIPNNKAKKPLWAHGLDTLSYSVSSLRLTNMTFKDVRGTKCSEVVRLQMSSYDTAQILLGCKSRGIKLCSVLSAASLIAAHSDKHRDHRQRRKYAVVTLTDCRQFLDPPLSGGHFGFYHSAILNIHVVKGGETLWDLASNNYTAFANSKNSNKHFSDMADLNFLMRKAIESPSLTPSSSLRTSLISVFEDPIIDNSQETEQAELGLEDFMGCSSVHGVGPSIAIFDTIQDGQLDCIFVYPSPLHSREQMQELVDDIKKILVHGSKCVVVEG